MKALILALTLISAPAFAAVLPTLGPATAAEKHAPNTTNPTDLPCPEAAKKFLANRLNVGLDAIKFVNGALLGDGAWSVEADMFAVDGKNGLYKVEFDAEECSPRGQEEFIN